MSQGRGATASRGWHWRDFAAIALAILGSLQMAGYILGSDTLRGLGAASAMSPLPKVFSDVDGLETFASAFTLRYREQDGTAKTLPITPEVYGRLSGPYNRRNVYGAALSYAPRLPTPLWEAAFCYGLGTNGPLRTELGLGQTTSEFSVSIETRTAGRSDRWTLDPRCR